MEMMCGKMGCVRKKGHMDINPISVCFILESNGDGIYLFQDERARVKGPSGWPKDIAWDDMDPAVASYFLLMKGADDA